MIRTHDIDYMTSPIPFNVMPRTAVILCILALSCGGALAQEIQAPEKVTVELAGDDPVGQSLAYEIREKISSSNQMELVEMTGSDGKVKITLITLDPHEGTDRRGTSTVYSITWSYLLSDGSNSVELRLASTVGLTTPDRVERTARSLTATTDEQRRTVVEEVKSLAQMFTGQ